MALALKGLPQVSQDGRYLWFTDKTGVYNLDTNEGGWGAPNPNLNESAMLFWIYRMSNPKTLINPTGTSVKQSVSTTNSNEFAFQGDYLADGVHEFHSARLMASNDDVNSIDGTPVVFTEGDIWYNIGDGNVKQMVSSTPTVLDISDTAVLDAIVENDSVVHLVCDQIMYKDLAVEKSRQYQQEVRAIREDNKVQQEKARENQTIIQNHSAAAAYQFSYGMKVEAQNTIESLLDDFNL